MTSLTGNQCSLYDSIDALSGIHDSAEWRKGVQAILTRLANFVIMGDAAMQAGEEWHDDATDELYRAAGIDYEASTRPETRVAPRPAPKASSKTQQRRFNPEVEEEEQRQLDSSHRSKNGRNKGPLPPPVRPSPQQVPSSLMAIMNGTHASFREPDD